MQYNSPWIATHPIFMQTLDVYDALCLRIISIPQKSRGSHLQYMGGHFKIQSTQKQMNETFWIITLQTLNPLGNKWEVRQANFVFQMSTP